MFFDCCNTTVSSVDEKGDLYYASFDFLPKKSGDSKHIFKGMLFGRGPRNGRKCAVKLKRESFTTSPEDWLPDINAAQAAKAYAVVFNNHVLRQDNSKIRFRVPFAALIDTVTGSYSLFQIFAFCVGRDLKEYKPDRDEYVLVEDYIRGDFSKLNANNGWKSTNRNFQELQAFAHFTWCYSSGELVLGDVQGVQTDRQYSLTDPVIHSKNKLFGDRDRGQDGIDDFFKDHSCNDICKNWAKPFKGDINLLESVQQIDKCNNNNNNNNTSFKAPQMSLWPPPYPIDIKAENTFDNLTKEDILTWPCPIKMESGNDLEQKQTCQEKMPFSYRVTTVSDHPSPVQSINKMSNWPEKRLDKYADEFSYELLANP